jgi:hypothetical protein
MQPLGTHTGPAPTERVGGFAHVVGVMMAIGVDQHLLAHGEEARRLRRYRPRIGGGQDGLGLRVRVNIVDALDGVQRRQGQLHAKGANREGVSIEIVGGEYKLPAGKPLDILGRGRDQQVERCVVKIGAGIALTSSVLTGSTAGGVLSLRAI